MGILLDSNKMEARLPLDKLTRAKEALQQWSHRKSATLKEHQSLICTLQFACRAVVPGRAFLQRFIGLTKGISNSRWHVKLNAEFRKNISMWLTFLDHWNGASFFLGDTVVSSSELQLFTDASGSLSYGGYLNGFPNTASTLPALTGRNFLLYILPALFGVPSGLVNVFAFGATTYPLLQSLTPNVPNHPGSWIWSGLLPY